MSLATRYQGARAAMQALDKQMQLPTEREAGRAYVPTPALTGRIGLTGVSFAYPQTGPEAQVVRVLKELQLQFSPGERVAILGRIGSGKSTILRLLSGLYQPTEGMVEVDGIDLRQIDPTDYRARVGLVTQEPAPVQRHASRQRAARACLGQGLGAAGRGQAHRARSRSWTATRWAGICRWARWAGCSPAGSVSSWPWPAAW